MLETLKDVRTFEMEMRKKQNELGLIQQELEKLEAEIISKCKQSSLKDPRQSEDYKKLKAQQAKLFYDRDKLTKEIAMYTELIERKKKKNERLRVKALQKKMAQKGEEQKKAA